MEIISFVTEEQHDHVGISPSLEAIAKVNQLN